MLFLSAGIFHSLILYTSRRSEMSIGPLAALTLGARSCPSRKSAGRVSPAVNAGASRSLGANSRRSMIPETNRIRPLECGECGGTSDTRMQEAGSWEGAWLVGGRFFVPHGCSHACEMLVPSTRVVDSLRSSRIGAYSRGKNATVGGSSFERNFDRNHALLVLERHGLRGCIQMPICSRTSRGTQSELLPPRRHS